MPWDTNQHSGESEGAGTASGRAPGKSPRSAFGFGPAVQAVDILTKLPPHLVEILDSGDMDRIAYALKALPPGKGTLDAAFKYLRTMQGATFVEQLSREVFPRREREKDWLGVGQFLHDAQFSDGDSTNDPRPLKEREECAPADAVVPDVLAVEGVQLYVRADRFTLERPDTVHAPGKFGPAKAGPYILKAHTFQDRIMFWSAHHEQRKQDEWIIGPAAIDEFTHSAPLYAGTAAVSLPGAPDVPDSQADGADKPTTEPSLVEKEAHGSAPWQLLARAADDTNGGTAAVAAANSAIRIAKYEVPARRMAAQIAADLESGKLDHLTARDQAVGGRNVLLESVRKDVSPGARRVSRTMKGDEGVSVAKMQQRKTRELLKKYGGQDKKGRPLPPAQVAAWREIADADTELWAQYAKAVDDPAVFEDAMRSLGERPEVSKAIVRSAGRPNRIITRVAALQLVSGAAGAVLGAVDMYQEIADADEAHKLHVAARSFAGFTGGIVGAEGAVFIASAIATGLAGGPVSAPVMLVVSLLAGGMGGAAGALAGTSLVDLIAQGAAGGLIPGHSMGAAGGLGGIHSRDHAQGQNVGQAAAGAIFKLDEQVSRFDRAIPSARDQEELQALQRRRLELLDERANLEDLLMSVRVGAFEANESRATEPEPPAAPPPSSTMPQVNDCPDDDCDDEVW